MTQEKATTIASQFSTAATSKAFRFLGYRFNETETAGIAKQLDAELQEVREVLTQLAEWPWPTGEPCWCHLEGEHSEACQRARALMTKLEIKEK